MSHMYKEVFAPRLRYAREFNGFTQKEVAKILKISESAYSNYEAGKREPNIQTIAMISKLMEVTADWLIGLSSESKIGSIIEAKEEIQRQKVLAQMEKEARLNKRVWG